MDSEKNHQYCLGGQGLLRIDSLQDYNKYKSVIVEPLLDDFIFEIWDRKALIKALFPTNSPENDSKYYRWIWSIKRHWCENCGKPLKDYSAVYISHIKTRGSNTQLRYDPKNSNILCMGCHNKWEYGTLSDKQKMYIYWDNERNDLL